MDLATVKKVEESLKKIFGESDISHGLTHALAVARNAELIAGLSGLDEKIDMLLLRTGCLLHDLSYAWRKNSFFMYWLEGWFTARYIKKHLKHERINVRKDDEKVLLNIALRHNFTFPFGSVDERNDVYVKLVQDADIIEQILAFKNQRIGIARKSGDAIRRMIDRLIVNFACNRPGRYFNFPEITPNLINSLPKP